MFTGLIETVGRVEAVTRKGAGGRLEVSCAWPDGDLPRAGDSIAVNGACLTAVEPRATGFAADLSAETLARTLLGDARPGRRVNLERALKLGARLGGHLVQGHVDGVTRLISLRPEGGCSRWRLALPAKLAAEVAEKGSVAVDGVSLTVAGLGADWFEVALIPATLAATTLGEARPGDRLHLETDVLAKYVGRRLGAHQRSPFDELFGHGGGDAAD